MIDDLPRRAEGICLFELPNPLPTTLCFGGQDMKGSWVTSAIHGELVKTR
jgi:sugar lactone lactonase YvrE